MSDVKIVSDCKDNMTKCLKSLEGELSKIRTGRASITVLDGVMVDYYGSPTPVNQVATLSTPDPRMIVVSPFEKSMISPIERAIQAANLGLTPASDGNVVRLPIPPLSEERRKGLAKQIKELGEKSKVAIRQARREANDKIKKDKGDKKLTEDDAKRMENDVQKATETFEKQVDERLTKKEKEVMTI
jgi:ribosome recycling factor